MYLITFNLLIFTKVFAQYQGHGIESIPKETLIKYAPPMLEPEMSNKLKKILDVSSPGMGILSPDKKTLYFSWKVTGNNQIWKIKGPQGFPVQLTSGQDQVYLNDVSPDGKFLILSKDANGQENPGIYKLDLQTGLIEMLYHKTKVRSRYSFISNDSQFIYFTSNEKKQDSFSIYRMNLKNRLIETLFDEQGTWDIADHLEKEKRLLLVKYNGSMQNEYFDYNTVTKELKPVIGQGELEEYNVVYVGRKNEYFVISNKTTDFKKLYLMSRGQLKPIGPDINFDISDFSIDESRSRLIYSINKNGYTEIGVLNTKSFKPIKIPNWPLPNNLQAEHIFAGQTTRDGRVTMLGIITPQSPRLSYSYDWNSRKLTQWVLPSAPEVNLNEFVKSELLYYETRDQVKIPMFVRFPVSCQLNKKERKNCPIIVRFHGGPASQALPGFSVISQAIVNEGFILVEPNVRGSEGYGKAWVKSDDGPNRENVITDIVDASIWIKTNWKNSDGSTPKIGVTGGSYGGYSTLMAMTRFSGSYDAGVAVVGMSDLISFLNNTAPYRRHLRIAEYGDPVKDKDALMKLSPINFIDQVKNPLMIIQGANDPRVPVGEAIQIHETLLKKKISSQLIIFADEGHGAVKKENQILEYGHIIDFFKKHLK